MDSFGVGGRQKPVCCYATIVRTGPPDATLRFEFAQNVDVRQSARVQP